MYECVIKHAKEILYEHHARLPHMSSFKLHTLNPHPHTCFSLFQWCRPPSWTLSLSLNSFPSCHYLPPAPPLFLSIFLSSSSSCHSLFILLLFPLLLHPFSICLSIPISFSTSRWLRNRQFAGCLDSWSSVPAMNLLSIYIYYHFGPCTFIVKQSGWPDPIYLASLLHFGRQFLISPHSGWHVRI